MWWSNKVTESCLLFQTQIERDWKWSWFYVLWRFNSPGEKKKKEMEEEEVGCLFVGSQREETFSLVTTALARNSYPPSSRNVWSPPLRLFANINLLLNLANFKEHLRVPRPLRASTEKLARSRKDDEAHSFWSITGVGFGVKFPTCLPWVNLKKADIALGDTFWKFIFSLNWV